MNKEKINIYFTYHTIDTPRGGANSLTRATRKAFIQSDKFEVMQSPTSDCDVLFMFQVRTGPALGKLYFIDFKEVQKMHKAGTRVVVKALNIGYTPAGYMDPNDRFYKVKKLSDIKRYYKYRKVEAEKKSLLHMADNVVFESHWHKDIYMKRGYKGSSWSVIHNGADEVFTPAQSALPLEGNIKMLSCGTSTNVKCKRHSLISELSKYKGVEMHYAGEWPDGMDSGNIILHGILPHNELAELWKTMHYCYHPAIYDICPNAVCEALASGIPVIYNPNGGGTVELASKSGITLQENNLSATIEEARERYNECSSKARANWEYYTINRACREYMDVIKKCL